jgi:type IX secretion system PorP/SprF family membrane protein
MLILFTICTLLLVAVSFKASSQDALFSQFYANPLYLNPAFAGVKRCTRISMNYRNQPFPSLGTFSTYSFSADTYAPKLSGGIGFNVIHDNQAGLIGRTQAGAFYAWQGILSQNWSISLGLEGSYHNHRLYSENLVFPDQYSTTGNLATSGELLGDALSSHTLDFSGGFLVYTNEFYLGASAHHLTQPAISIYNDQKLALKYSFVMGYKYTPGKNTRTENNQFSFSPNIIIQSQSGYYRLNYGTYAQVGDITAGVWFRHNLQHPNTLIFTLGLKQVNYTVGYSYDYSLSGYSDAFGGAHEIGVLLNFNCPEPNMKYRILNCPTF